MNAMMKEINQKIVEESINWFILVANSPEGIVADREVISHIALIVECTGGELDACSHCGAMPMTANCNNARCDQ